MRKQGAACLAIALLLAGCGLVQKPNFNRGPADSRKPAPTKHLKAPRAAAPARPAPAAKSASSAPAPARASAAAKPAAAAATAPAPDTLPAARTEAPALGVPADEVPPIGACRVWIPGAPVEAQHPAGPCDVVQKKVPAGAWVLHRASTQSNEVAVNVYRSRWPYTISETRYFDYWTGRLLRVE